MVKPLWSLLLVLGCITSVQAQESLLPTHISDAGEVTVTAFLRFQAGQGTLTNPASFDHPCKALISLKSFDIHFVEDPEFFFVL